MHQGRVGDAVTFVLDNGLHYMEMAVMNYQMHLTRTLLEKNHSAEMMKVKEYWTVQEGRTKQIRTAFDIPVLIKSSSNGSLEDLDKKDDWSCFLGIGIKPCITQYAQYTARLRDIPLVHSRHINTTLCTDMSIISDFPDSGGENLVSQ